jgi:hypothetical protein
LKPFDKDVGLVECSLWQAPLEEAHYTAISYAWGDPAVTEPILVAGETCHVTTNLAACLKRLAICQAAEDSAGDGGVNLWVDAICINQTDVAERNAQVLRMKEIFPHADGLIVWLGEEGPDTGRAVERIKDVTQVLDGLNNREDGNGVRLALEKLPIHMYSRTTDAQEMTVRRAVMDIYTRPWWKRTWILQEIGLSKNIVVYCGYYEMTFEMLESFQMLTGFLLMESPDTIFETAGGEGMPMVEAAKLPMAVLNLMDDLKDEYASTLHALVDTTKNHEATDPRDKIYGILGLSSDFDSGVIFPRYDQPVQEAYLNVVKAHFKLYDSLDILDQCYYAHTAALGLPSWRPNWDLPDVDEVLPEPVYKYMTNRGQQPQQAFHACGDMSLSDRPWSFGDDNHTLHLTGACFDTITSLTEAPDFLRGSTLESLLEAWLLAVPTPSEKYPFTNETWLAAFRRTVVLDVGFLPRKRGFSMVFPDDPDSKEQATFLNRIGEARPAFYMACYLKRLAITSKGMMGLVRRETRVGDRVAVLVGSKVLHCLREVSTDVFTGDVRYQLVGEAYFHGMMDGEAMDGLELGNVVLV